MSRTLERQLRQSQKMESLGMLAGGIVHDFNNILTGIGAHTVLALNAQPTHDVQDSLHRINQALIRAKTLVAQLLTYSQRTEVERRSVVMSEVIEEALALLRAALPSGVKVRASCASALPTVIADPTQIHQVLINLGTNAGHAIGDGCGTLSVDVDQLSIDADSADGAIASLAPGSYVRVRVSDTGAGIHPAHISRIFDPFFTTKGRAGTGLGLFTARGIMQDHRGAITVESELGQGTTFCLLFPTQGSGTRRQTLPRGTRTIRQGARSDTAHGRR